MASRGKKNMALKDILAKNKVIIREYDRERDVAAVEKLERSCEIGASRGFSIVTNMMGDPLCRIRLFPLHIMLVAEVGEAGEIVGVVRGCMKRVGTGVASDDGGSTVLIGCILGLRVSSMHRRKGIGLKLTRSMEAWAALHGAQHVVAATEATNIASRSLFAEKCGYATSASMSILIQPLPAGAASCRPQDVRIKKLTVEQAALLYKRRFCGEPLCPSDVDAVLSAPLSLGTWVARFEDGAAAAAWACMSLWNTCASYKLQVVKPAGKASGSSSKLLSRFAVAMPCLGTAARSRPAPCGDGQFGFLFAYGLDGEGGCTALGRLVSALWGLAASAARRAGAEYRALVIEAAAGDPVARHVPRGRHTAFVNDVWLVKAVGTGGAASRLAPTARRRFVDPRDF